MLTRCRNSTRIEIYSSIARFFLQWNGFLVDGISHFFEEEEEILFCHNSLTIKHNYRNNIHGRMPEKAHAHRGWPPMVINNAQYKTRPSMTE